MAVIITGVSCLLLLPVALWWFGAGDDGAKVAQKALLLMLLWQVLPLMLGMAFAKFNSRAAHKLAAVLKWLSNACLVLLIIGFAVFKGAEFFQLPAQHLMILSVFVLLTFSLPALITKSSAQRSALVFTTSTRNLNLGLLIVVDVLRDDALLTYVLVYCAIMYTIWPVATIALRKMSSER